MGAVYALTNAASGNAVAVFDRRADGSISYTASVPTGGLGTGSGLGSQGAVALSEDGRWLFAVNAGSNDISSFAVTSKGLALRDRASSGGAFPISLTSHNGLLYVLNAGGVNNITGFTVRTDGRLWPIANSTRSLSGSSVGPAQVSFSPNGDLLVVTEKATNRIDTFVVGSDGLTTGPTVFDSSGMTPFGFGFGLHDTLIVSEAFGGTATASAVSSYHFGVDGGLSAVTPSAATHQTAACWIAITNNGKYAYTTNAGSATVSGYAIGQAGDLSLLDASGVTDTTGAGPADIAFSGNSRYLYVRNGGAATISAYRVEADGSLTSLGWAGGLPAGSAGLAAR
jgi:6-phosphogluconolactonase (cycloisomerase 2 family)